MLDKPIKSLGLHELRVSLHPEVQVKVSVNVARSEDEAQRQARGENVAVIRDEAIELYRRAAPLDPGGPAAQRLEQLGVGAPR